MLSPSNSFLRYYNQKVEKYVKEKKLVLTLLRISIP